MKRLVGIFLSVLASASCDVPDELSFHSRESHSIVHSLPNSTIVSFVEDNYGYMWMGTSRGVVRYDGEQYHHYLHDRNYGNSLPSNFVCSMFKDSEGGIWVGTNAGVAKMNDKDEFVPVEYDHSDYKSESVLSFAETGDGRLFLSTGDMIEEYDPEADMFIRRMLFDNGKAVSRFFFDSGDRLWYLSDGLVRCRQTVDNEEEILLGVAGVTDMVMLDNSVICILHPDGFYIWSIELNVPLYDGKVHSQGKFRHEDILSVHPGNGTSFYFVTRHSDVFLYDFSSRELTSMSAPSGTRMVYLDTDDNLWFGTEKNGFKVVCEAAMTEAFGYGITHAYNGIAVESIYKVDEGSVLVNTRGQGLYLCDFYEETVSRIKYEPFTRLQPQAVCFDSEGRIWVATSNRCHVFAQTGNTPVESGEFIRNENSLKELYSFPTEKAMMFLEDHHGNVWLSTHSHYIYVLPAGSSEMKSVKLEVESGYMYVPELHLSDDGKILALAFLYGVFEIDPVTLEVKPAVDIRPDVDFNFQPLCMASDSRGLLWLGTLNKGAFVYDEKTGEVSSVMDIDCECIYTLTEDADGSMWASTANGLYCCRKDGDVIWFPGSGDVIEGELSNHSAVMMGNGQMLFGGSGGLFVAGTQISGEKREVNLNFDDIFMGGLMVSPTEGGIIEKDLKHSPEVKISKMMGPVSISFSSPHFWKGSPVDYWYKLEGYDKDWQKAFFEKMIQYSSLPEGRYRLILEARNRISGDVLQSASLNVRVISPLFTSRLMVLVVYPLLCVLLVFFVLKHYVRYRRHLGETRRVMLEKQKEQELNKMNVSFFTNMSHEFRTPLSLILGPMSEITAELEDTPYNRGLISTVKNSVNRMMKLVDQIMDFSKLETDALNLSLCECDAADMFGGIVSAFRYNCAHKGIELEVSETFDGRKVLLDADKFEKILNNLMSNAVKYTPGGPGARIWASLSVVDAEQAASLFPSRMISPAGDFMLLSVADTGPGIPENMRQEIFERYRRLDLPGQEKEFGSGIGLYYARRLATLHHGILEACDSPFGHGSCFRLLLPMDAKEYEGELIVNGTPADIQIESGHFEDTVSRGEGTRPVILLVEDDVDLASYISSLLGRYYDVRVRYSADDAANDIRFQSPDMVITDVMLPGEKDGLALCAGIKENIETCHIPVMILSAKSTIDDQIRGIETGADSYVVKPVVPAYLLTLTKTLLFNRENLRARLKETTDVSNISEKDLSPQDRLFLESLYDLMEKQLSAVELNVDMVAESMKISRAKLYYKFKGLINETPNSFFKKYKLNRAAELIKSGKYNISEVADMTGFSSLSYFSVSFKKQFGVKPSDYS